MKILLKKVVSVALTIDAVVIIITSLILFIVPHGRVAYWSNWKLWGLTKTEWANIHINTGFLFIILAAFHFYFNWKPFLSYLKNKARDFRLFTREFNIAFLLILVTLIGTYFMVPPFSSVINLGESIKDNAGLKYGEPPYGHAELSGLNVFCEKVDLDLEEALIRLKEKGIAVKSAKQKIGVIAEENNLTPKELYMIMKETESVSQIEAMPATPNPGTGNKRLADLCNQYGLDIKKTVQYLKENKITANPEYSIKRIAENNALDAHDVYSIIYEMQKKEDHP